MVETNVKTERIIAGVKVQITPKVIVPISRERLVGML